MNNVLTEATCGISFCVFLVVNTLRNPSGFFNIKIKIYGARLPPLCQKPHIYAEIIADGRHLPPELIRLILKIKGTEHVVLCTDSLALSGTEVTEGITLNVPFIIEDGVCKLKDRSAFAGSIATADMLIRVMTKEVGIDIEVAVKMLTKIPAEILGLNYKGTIAIGMDADIVVFDDDVNMQEVFVLGKQLA